MARRVAISKEQTLEQILSTAFRLFGRFGLEGVSIAKISGEAELSKAALYWHFDNKEQLYVACLKRLYAMMDEAIFEPMLALSNPLEQLDQFFLGIQRLLESHELDGIAGYWLDVHEDESPDINAVREAAEARQARAIADMLEEGQRQGIMQFDQDHMLMARSFLAVMQAAVLPMRLHSAEENRITLDVLKTTFARAFVA